MTDRSQPRFTPPRWANRLMTAMLKTPGIQRLPGKSTALVTFTGRRSGRRITTPISYTRNGNTVIVTGHRTRRWLRSIEANPAVHLRLAGEDATGTARVLDNEEEALAALIPFLEEQPVIARASKVAISDGHADADAARTMLDYTAVVAIELDVAG